MLKKVYCLLIIGTLFFGGIVFAGTFTPDPASPDSSFYTLSDIYNKINDGTEAATHDFAPTLAPAGTFKTLTEIWDAISWNTFNNSGVIDAGFYATSSLETAEPNLLASNIAAGTVLFGITGTCEAQPEIPTDGLVSYWSLDGNANDSWGSNDGTVNNAVLATGINDLPNTAYYFDGDGDYIDLNSEIIPSTFTLSAWVKNTIDGTAGMIIGNCGNMNLYVELSGGSYLAGITVEAPTATYKTAYSTTVVNDDVWHQIVGIFDNTNVYIYVDGVLENQTPASGAISTDGINTLIGSRGASCGAFFYTGLIDEVRIYGRALTEEEVANLYYAEKP